VGDEWKIDPSVIDVLTRYSWPGNVRQLQNAIDRAKILADHDEIVLEHLPPEVISDTRPSTVTPSSATPQDLESINRAHVLSVYERFNHNKTRTARALGISRRSFYRLLEKYDIE